MEKLCIIMPLYNDWRSAAVLISKIDQVIAQWDSHVALVMVDDGSQETMPDPDEIIGDCTHIEELQVIRLVCNQGHQRAIAVGLAYVQSRQCFSSVFIMDSDGEDSPDELNDLYAAGRSRPEAIITADRASRSEGMVFRVGYKCYRFLFYLLTGTSIRFGNFCYIPACQMDRLVHYPDLWNSLSGCIKKSRLPMAGIPSHRANRLIGFSKMNFTALVLHGLSAISVFKDVIMVRMMIAAAIVCVVTAVLGMLSGACSVFGLSSQGVSLTWLAVLFFLFSFYVFLMFLVFTLGFLHQRAHRIQGPIHFWKSYVKSIDMWAG
jgi:glycosyltransferase involved in cell wall biosynthesis